MKPSLIIARKEIRDHVRDTRSLLSSVLHATMGPAVVMLVSFSEPARNANGRALLLSMLSVFALVSVFTGGMNIAMDSTAGERERRSLLPLLLNPTPRSALVVGKWIAVTLFALAGLALNVAGLVIVMVWAAPSLLVRHAPQIAMWVWFGLVPLAPLGAALNLFVAATCRTTKEAHTCVAFLMIAPMLAGMFLVFFPGRIADWWVAMPIVGQQALIAFGMQGHHVPLARGAVLAAVTIAAAAPALLGATRVLNRDDMLEG
jgi:sodium transport system permease protein